MKILQVNNTDFQGSIYNGHNLQISLNQAGIPAEELVLYRRTGCCSSDSFCTNREIEWQHQFNTIENQTALLNLLEPFGERIATTPQFLSADIVHYQLLHCHVLTLPAFARMCQLKPSVWSIHDLWAVTGHCIHPLDCEEWKNGCVRCRRPEDPFFSLSWPKAGELWKVKEQTYRQINPDIIVASDFTKRYIEQSPLTAHFSHIHKIPFGLDMDNFVYEEEGKIREELGIPFENVVISFRLNNSKLKGIALLVEALKGINQKNITILSVDEGDSLMLDPLRSKWQVVELGTQDWKGMQKFYQVSDIFVMPSMAETFGLMAIEAMAFRCAVVVFDHTVLTEVTFAPKCGVSVPFMNVQELGKTIGRLSRSPEEREKRGNMGQDLVYEHYKYSDYVKKHIEIYQEIEDRTTEVDKKCYQSNYKKLMEENEEMEKKAADQVERTEALFQSLMDLAGGKALKIAVFCAGIFGEKAYELLEQNCIPVDYVADNEPKKWGYWNHGLFCISKEQLKQVKDITLVIVANKYPQTIEQELREEGFQHVINYYQLQEALQKGEETSADEQKSLIAQMDYSDPKFVELMDLMNRKIFHISRYYQEKMESLQPRAAGAKPVKAIAMYLPQFHETKENNEWWGKGFTEWMAVKRAKPLFEGHYQPREPLQDNYYNLLEKETMEWQVKLAQEANLYGFCFYHYWFKDGRRVLEKPAENLLRWKELDIHYCFSWANESWIRTWSNVKGGNAWIDDEINSSKDGADERGVLLEQQYGTQKDWKLHFEYLLPFFEDERYIRIDGKPVFMIYRPELVDCLDEMLSYWKNLALDHGLPGLYIMCANCRENIWKEVDARYIQEFNYSYSIECEGTVEALGNRNGVLTYDYDVLWKNILNRKYDAEEKVFLGACVDFDCTPRHGKRGNLVVGGNPEKFGYYFGELCKKSIRRNNEYVFINAWNEWGEGMHLEPDKRYGLEYLNAVRAGLATANKDYAKLSLEEDFHTNKNVVDVEKFNYVSARDKKFTNYFYTLDSWLTAKEAHKNIGKLLLQRGFSTIALYGRGKLGEHFIRELENSEVKIKYTIDRKGMERSVIPAYVLSDSLPEVDVIIVTATFDFENIQTELKKYFTCPIISLQEVFQW